MSAVQTVRTVISVLSSGTDRGNRSAAVKADERFRTFENFILYSGHSNASPELMPPDKAGCAPDKNVNRAGE